MRILDRLRLWNQVRAAIKQVLREDGSAAVEDLLRQNPAASRGVARRARSMADVFPVHSLQLAVGLARCGAPEAIALIRWLADREYGWESLGQEALRDLRRHLVNHEAASVLEAVRQRMEDRQLAWILPEVDEDDFLAEFSRLKGDQAVSSAVRYIADFIEDVELGQQPAGRGLDNATAAATLLWDRGRAEEALQLWTSVAIARPQDFDSERLLPAAYALPKWIPRPEPLSFEDLPARAQLVMPVPPRVVRAADLLADFPRVAWIEPLRQAWLAVDDLVRRDAREEQLERNPQRLMAAQSIAAALGACAALDREMRVLVRDEAGHRQRHEAIRRQVDRRNHLVGQYNALVAEYRAGKEEVVDALRQLQGQIGQLDDVIADAREALRGHLTPAALLRQVVADAQSYPLEVRQGAAWGIHRIVEDGGLEETARGQLQVTLRAALRDRELDESAVRGRVAALLPEGDERLRELLASAERYAADGDADELTATACRLAPESPTLAKELRDGVDSSLRSRTRGEFVERVLRILPGSRLLELVGTLRRGLRWMVELVEGRPGSDPALESNLRWIAALVGRELPGVTDFLSKYPLRLMTLDRHRQILGLYSRDKIQLEFWTRFTPPRWFRGANPSELGEVHRRYLDLDDRSAPNAMGLYYRLFEHPVLVLPVLYHEFLHYGGPEGDPKLGIENETEVLLREVLFARHMLARLAPDDDDELRGYEQAVAAAIERTELFGLARQLFFEFEDDAYLSAINDHIAQTYGEGLGASAAEIEVDCKIERWNRDVQLTNLLDEAKRSWCPQINWPELGSPETRDLSNHLRAVLSRVLQQNHRLATRRRDEVLSEPGCRRHCDDWARYRKRSSALVELHRRFSSPGLDRGALQVIVQRFHLDDPRVPWSEVSRLVRALGLAEQGA